MDKNYTMKYALMPIIKKIGLRDGLYGKENVYDIECFIVSRCYLLDSKDKYEVVYPFIENNYEWKSNRPIYNTINGMCMNSLLVDEVYDSYEDACKVKIIRNEEIKKKQYHNRFLSRVEIKEKEKKFDEKMELYNMLELLLEYESCKLDIDKGITKIKRLDVCQKNQK